MAGLEQLNSFIGKFVSLWQAGLDASLELKTFQGKASAHIHVGLGQAPCLQKTRPPQPHHVPSPSRVRRRARREEARRIAAEPSEQVEAGQAEDAGNMEARQVENIVAEEAVIDEAENAYSSDVVQEVVNEVNSTVIDEICPNDEYFSKLENTVKTKCTIQLVPVNQSNIRSFRDSVEKYFNQRKDVIESVVDCRVENAGRNVRLETIVSRQRWINFFNDPEANYSDLADVKKVVHDCRDLANCDKIVT